MSDKNSESKLIEKLKNEPLFEERVEFGKMLFRHIDSFTPKERERYEELKEILLKYSEEKNKSKFSNSDIGSYHWFFTVTGKIIRIGEALKEGTVDEKIINEWGEFLYEAGRELGEGYKQIKEQ